MNTETMISIKILSILTQKYVKRVFRDLVGLLQEHSLLYRGKGHMTVAANGRKKT